MTQWQFDPAHSNADFSVRHMMVSNVRGGFKAVTGTLNFDPDNPGAASVEATIDATSVWTGVDDRDAHLRSPDFLDVENYPVITFKSTNVNADSNNKAQVNGDLTIRGVTKSVVLDVEFLGEGRDPFMSRPVLGFSATTKIDREDFGLTWNQALETGGVLVGKDIKISLDVEVIPVVEAEAV